MTNDFSPSAKKWGKWCRPCVATQQKDIRERRKKKGHKVYYLPEEHYVGMSCDIKKRINQHRFDGKITDGFEVIATFEREVDAHWFETSLHIRGYNGYRKA